MALKAALRESLKYLAVIYCLLMLLIIHYYPIIYGCHHSFEYLFHLLKDPPELLINPVYLMLMDLDLIMFAD